MNGALPPSSMDSFFSVPALWAISFLPTSVEPVNVQLADDRIRRHLAADLGRAAGENVQHAARNASACGELRHGKRGIRRLCGGLADERAASRERWADFARDHRSGKFQGVIAATTPTG